MKTKARKRQKRAAVGKRNSSAWKSAEIQLSPTTELVALQRIRQAHVNDKVYKPVDLSDLSISKLGESIAQKGLLEPIVITLDDVIISGHRRRAGCEVAGLDMVPVRRISILSTDPRFEEYLVDFNQQRVKTIPEQIREEVIRTSPEDAHNELLHHRAVEQAKAFERIENSGLRVLNQTVARRRSRITRAKRPMLEAAIAVLEEYRDYWPLTLRQIHYRLLTRNVLRNADKPENYLRKGVLVCNLYRNSQESYKDLSNLLTRARLIGEVPWESMHDPTRPKTAWQQWENVGEYTRQQLDRFLCNYKRNLLQSQPAYVELVVEKITVHEIANRAAGRYHVPVGVGRGYTSVTSLDETAERFRASGKDRCILLIAGDLDPEGENIAETWDACLRGEHGVENLTTVKVGVNPDQVVAYNLSPLPVKESSSRASGFKAIHGKNVYELEAFEPDQLQSIFRDAIRNVLDMELFAEEQRRESEDARHLMACKKKVQESLKGLDFAQPDPEEDEE
jgi:hypothetical protein